MAIWHFAWASFPPGRGYVEPICPEGRFWQKSHATSGSSFTPLESSLGPDAHQLSNIARSRLAFPIFHNSLISAQATNRRPERSRQCRSPRVVFALPSWAQFYLPCGRRLPTDIQAGFCTSSLGNARFNCIAFPSTVPQARTSNLGLHFAISFNVDIEPGRRWLSIASFHRPISAVKADCRE
jgi:hypothetical protein